MNVHDDIDRRVCGIRAMIEKLRAELPPDEYRRELDATMVELDRLREENQLKRDQGETHREGR